MKGLGILIILVVAVLLTGCSHIEYISKDGASVSSTRVFMAASNIEAQVGAAKVKMGQSTPDAAALAVVVEYLSKLVPLQGAK